MWDILAWIIIGGVAGGMSTFAVQGGGMGFTMDIAVGVVGASLAGAVLTFLQPDTFVMSGLNLFSLIVALSGAAILLVLVRALTGSRRRAY
ncbi:MAG TPA: GlsB/YeaQ/YmgE family stress response membrane protein [Ktedonobacterales bacterium]|jgi:uncharacterized membrane protein YeaQ/YmgE (transglycosylase-associated protein family)|nr:GlsB/YeaQ/YmgE family stress response membrane protein [Ktedonobacterales bacterium]